MENIVYALGILAIVVLIIIVIIKEHRNFVKENEIRNKELERIRVKAEKYKDDLGYIGEKQKYDFGKWEEEVRKDMKSIVDIKQKYSANKEIKILIGDYI